MQMKNSGRLMIVGSLLAASLACAAAVNGGPDAALTAINLSFAGPGHRDLADADHVKASAANEPFYPHLVSDWSGMSGIFPAATACANDAGAWITGTSPTWLAWDLGATCTISRIRIWNCNDSVNASWDWGVNTFDLQTASTAPAEYGGSGTWENVPGHTGIVLRPAGGMRTDEAGQDVDLATPVATRYIRFNNMACFAQPIHSMGLSEVVFFGPASLNPSGPADGEAPGGTAGTTVEFYATGEEFAGPFPSWQNVRSAFGAKGDGVTDDTAALTAGLDSLKNRESDGYNVLYIPAGTYRITGTLRNTGRAHGDDFSGMTIVGEDPATTAIVFDGPGTDTDIMELDGWETKVSRLTLDGKSKARNGILRNGGFSTYSEFSDLFIRNLTGQGIQLGGESGQGQAEVTVRRCRFSNIANVAVFGPNMNTMDEYIWDSLFEDCGTGIAVGGWHAVGNVFLRSKQMDFGATWYPPVIMNNISIDSVKFSETGGNVTCALYKGNKVYNCGDLSGFQWGGPQNSVYLDNLFACRVPVDIQCPSGNHVYIGNTFTRAAPIKINGTHVEIGSRIVEPASVPVPRVVNLPGTPPNMRRKVFEVEKGTGDDAAAIQRQIMAACRGPAAGANPIVHIPKGVYTLTQTITVPARKDMQIVGDAASEYGTVIRWGGAGTGPGFRLRGPSRVTMRDIQFMFVNSSADCVVVENADQVGGRIYCDQVHVGGNQLGQEAKHCFYIDGVENSDVIMVNGGIVNVVEGGAGVLVRGGPDRAAGGNNAKGQAVIMFGGWGNTYNLFDVVDGGRLVALGARDETIHDEGTYVNLTPRSSGMLTVGAMSWAVRRSPTFPLCKIDGFDGTFNFVANSALAGYPTDQQGSIFVQVTGNGAKTRVLCCAADIGHQKDLAAAWKDDSAPAAEAKVMACGTLPNVCNKTTPCAIDTNFIAECFEQLRDLRVEVPVETAGDVTDVKLLRVRVTTGTHRTGFTFTRIR